MTYSQLQVGELLTFTISPALDRGTAKVLHGESLDLFFDECSITKEGITLVLTDGKYLRCEKYLSGHDVNQPIFRLVSKDAPHHEWHESEFSI